MPFLETDGTYAFLPSSLQSLLGDWLAILVQAGLGLLGLLEVALLLLFEVLIVVVLLFPLALLLLLLLLGLFSTGLATSEETGGWERSSDTLGILDELVQVLPRFQGVWIVEGPGFKLISKPTVEMPTDSLTVWKLLKVG